MDTSQGRHRVQDLTKSWTRHLRAQERSHLTVKNYQRTTRLLTEWLSENQLPDDVREIGPDDLQDFILDIRERTSANNAAHHYRNLRALYSWARQHRNIDDPMPGVAKPKETRVRRPTLSTDDARRMLSACAGNTFHRRRDTAIIRLLLDTGVRASGLLGMRYAANETAIDNPVNDVLIDHDPPLVRFRLKGGEQHLVDVQPKTVLALDNYLNARAAHANAHHPGLWLTSYGQLGLPGLREILIRVADSAGLSVRVHPHMFRRTMATWGLDGNQSESTVMRRGGWRSHAMMQLYVTESEDRRAWAESQRLRIADRI